MNTISVAILNTEECYMLNKRLMNVFEVDLAEEATITKVMPRLAELNADLSAILAKNGAINLTDRLAAKDEARNAAFISFRDYCKAFVSEPDPAVSAAARKLTELIHKIGWTLYKQGYTEQTASQEALSDALTEPEYADAIIIINASDRVNNLQSTNADFEEFLKIKIETAAQTNIPSIKDCKKRMVRYLKPLLTYLELMAHVDTETYLEPVAKVAEAIEYVMTAAKARKTRKENTEAA